jgi:anhydro-N-acetylmuramic acid kinase
MSGSSCDGLDICLSKFSNYGRKWHYEIKAADTIPFSSEMANRLLGAGSLNLPELVRLDKEFGTWCGNRINDFLKNQSALPDFISSHGHTVFHRPDLGLTLQIGSGMEIGQVTGLPVVADFRFEDVNQGGQGAPLVPVGEKELFPGYDGFLNLGGIANITLHDPGGQIRAFDICPFNQAGNYLSSRAGLSYDHDGALGKKGKLIPGIFESLSAHPWFSIQSPKSLGREWIVQEYLPVFDQSPGKPENLLFTHYELSAHLIAEAIGAGKKKILVSGGGGKNTFFMEMLRRKTECDLVRAESAVEDFKEALIFGFLGVLRITNRINVYAKITGGKEDLSAGTIYFEERLKV